MHILAIIAPNGLGHYRRAVHVLDRLAARLPDARIDLVCERWQLERGSFAAATRARVASRTVDCWAGWTGWRRCPRSRAPTWS